MGVQGKVEWLEETMRSHDITVGQGMFIEWRQVVLEAKASTNSSDIINYVISCLCYVYLRD